MKKLLLILLFPTLLLADIDRVNEDVRLPYWPDYILSGDPNDLDQYFKILVKALQDIQDEIITTVNLGVDLDDTDVRYFGTKDGDGNYSDGDWRIIKVSAEDFEVQKLISGTWTQMSKWSAAGGFEYLATIKDSTTSFMIAAGTITGAVAITASGTVTAAEFVDSSSSGTSTEWEDAYNKRVDTWTAPLAWAANVASLAVASAKIIVGNASGVGVAVDMSGDVAIDNVGATTIQADSVALTTDTTGNYVASVTNGTSITGGDGGSEGAALTLDVADDSIDGTELADSITIDGTELDLTGDVEVTGQLKLSTSSAPASSVAAGETGDVQWGVDDGTYYVYVCVAGSTWRRAALATWGQEKVIYAAEDCVYAGEDIVYP